MRFSKKYFFLIIDSQYDEIVFELIVFKNTLPINLNLKKKEWIFLNFLGYFINLIY